MSDDSAVENAAFIEAETAWFQRVLERRFEEHAGKAVPADLPALLPPPPLPAEGLPPYASTVAELGLDDGERLLLILAFLPHFRPQALDPFFLENRPVGRRFTEFGGLAGSSHGGFLPTGETAMFLLAGGDAAARLRSRELFRPEHRLFSEGILELDHRHPEEPPLSAVLRLSPETLEGVVSGRPYEPPPSSEFPAQRLTTALEWEDLVLSPPSRKAVDEIHAWIRHEAKLMGEWHLDRRLKPG
ncbi:MAG: ATP-binding protein, partial [Acidobacteria bacterium]|nr:ATP-binding protein [Acidobacteriota bacterium]